FYFTMRSSVTTHTASQCATPGEPGSDGFTGCLRQLAGGIADGDECEPGMGDGPEATRDDLGVTVTCPTPGLKAGQVTYVHSDGTEGLKSYTIRLLNTIGGDVRVGAKWQGNALTGQYVSESGERSAVLVFRPKDRPIAGFLYQFDADDLRNPKSATELADYFEKHVQPGT